MSRENIATPHVVRGQIPSIDAGKARPKNSATERMLETLERSEALTRGPRYGTLQQMRIWDELAMGGVEYSRGAMTDFESRFRLPTTLDVTSGLKEYYRISASEGWRRRQEMSALCSLALSIRSPWLDMQGSLSSISGLSGLRGIGEALQSGSSFGPDSSDSLRSDLGDWRKIAIWPEEIFTDLGMRANFYADLGFNPVLTHFPEEAFHECLRNVGIYLERPRFVELYGTPVDAAETAEEEDGFDRNNQAHDRLQRLESRLRQFIDKMMTEAFGPNWPKHRLPNGVYEQWQEKRQQGATQGRGEEGPLITYADFTDYERVICKRDNWKIFETFFHRTESVRESFRRLHPIRLDTMHARPITQDDELLLYVETRRLMSEIEKEIL